MPDLSFQVDKAQVVPYAAAPLLAFKLRVSNVPADEEIQSIMLCCQVRMESDTCPGGLLWAHTQVMVPPFSSSVVVDLQVPCTFDHNVAAPRFFDAQQDGQVPLRLQFGGTVLFWAGDDGLQVSQIPGQKEVCYAMPTSVWRSMMDHYYPNTAWLCLHKEVFDRLQSYKRQHGLPTWEHTLERLLPEGGERR